MIYNMLRNSCLFFVSCLVSICKYIKNTVDGCLYENKKGHPFERPIPYVWEIINPSS